MTISEKCKLIKFLLTDVDGVLPDGRLYYAPHIEWMKALNVKDGLICKHLVEKNILVGYYNRQFE